MVLEKEGLVGPLSQQLLMLSLEALVSYTEHSSLMALTVLNLW